MNRLEPFIYGILPLDTVIRDIDASCWLFLPTFIMENQLETKRETKIKLGFHRGYIGLKECNFSSIYHNVDLGLLDEPSPRFFGTFITLILLHCDKPNGKHLTKRISPPFKKLYHRV